MKKNNSHPILQEIIYDTLKDFRNSDISLDSVIETITNTILSRYESIEKQYTIQDSILESEEN